MAAGRAITHDQWQTVTDSLAAGCNTAVAAKAANVSWETAGKIRSGARREPPLGAERAGDDFGPIRRCPQCRRKTRHTDGNECVFCAAKAALAVTGSLSDYDGRATIADYLSPRVATLLDNYGRWMYMDQLADRTDEELLAIHSVGPLVVRQIRAAIARWQRGDGDRCAGHLLRSIGFPGCLLVLSVWSRRPWVQTILRPSLTCHVWLPVLTPKPVIDAIQHLGTLMIAPNSFGPR